MDKRNLYKVLFNYFYQIKKSYLKRKLNFKSIYYFFHYLRFNFFVQKSNLDLEMPWITFRSFFFINDRKLSESNVFEFGSGGSTLFFASKGANVFTVEHDRFWFYELKKHLIGKKYINNIKITLIEPSQAISGIAISKNDTKYLGLCFDNYVDSILNYPNEFFDFILIDGRARPFCLINSINKVKKGGYIIFDNADRNNYQIALNAIEQWNILKSFGPTVNDLSFNQTNIYQKPF